MRLSRIIAFTAAAWRAGNEPEPPPCRSCLRPLGASEPIFCDGCADEEIRRRIGTLDPSEAVGWARTVALRDKEPELAAALQAVLLLHLTGGSLAPIAAMVRPEPTRDVVN